jgi:hypothetical protein
VVATAQASRIARGHGQVGTADPTLAAHRLRCLGKVINLHIPQLYSIVRGKVGKAVEFGLSWGITRLGGGFVLATMAGTKTDFTDASYAVRAVEDLAGLFGKATRAYAYDRGGYSTENVQRLRRLGCGMLG